MDWIDKALYDKCLAGSSVRYVCSQTYPAVRYAEAAVVTSGTATLETALIGTPEVVCYRTDALQIWAGRHLLKIKFISLVNLILGRRAVAEIIESSLDVSQAESELRAILRGGEARERMLRDFEQLREIVGGEGASDRFAAEMVKILRKG